jgi:acyl dehydratase
VTVIHDLGQLHALVGREVGVSDWITVSQDRITAFADTTGDHQWIHVDTARAAAESPFGTTIAHGFLTLSLISVMMRETVALRDLRMTINYGLNRVRFISPVLAQSRIRGRIELVAVDDVEGGAQATWSVTVEAEQSRKPSLVAEWLVRYYA